MDSSLMGKAEVTIPYLCSLGLQSHEMMPRLLALLHNYVPSFANVYFWLDEHGEVCDIYDEYPDTYAVLPTYLKEFYQSRELEVWGGLKSVAFQRQCIDADELWHSSRREALNSGFYHEFLYKAKHHWGIYRPLWINGKPRGILLLKRAIEDNSFVSNDKKKIDHIARHIEHALAHQQPKPHQKQPSTETDSRQSTFHTASQSASLIVSANGKIKHSTEGAARLIMLSQRETRPNLFHKSALTALMPQLQSLIKRLQKIQVGIQSKPASDSHYNKWGRFEFSAQSLDSGFSGFSMDNVAKTSANSDQHRQSSSQLFLIQIKYFAPTSVAILNQLDHFKLTNKQTQVCFNIGLGYSYADIASKLGVKQSTIITHKNIIFDKLGVSRRQDMTNIIFTHR